MNLLEAAVKHPEEFLIALDRVECAESLAEFVKRAWHVLEPSTPLVWGKVLDVMCGVLEDILENPGFQPRVMANVPPGTLKSMLWSVMFAAWVWGPKGMPEKSFTGVSHEQGLAIRDARKMRLLVESDWYQARWPIKMTRDQNAKTFFENEKRGFRQAVPFKSMTGRRSDFVIVDDSLSAEDANSPAYREEAKRIFRETLPTRVNNDNSAILIIQQRLHEEDTSGIILAEPDHFGYKTLILPMRFEPERADPLDWRTEEGELLFPERFPEESVMRLETMLMSYGTSGQLQQRPVPREGGMFKHSWFEGKFVSAAPEVIAWVRAWDLAATKKKTAARTAGVKMGKTRDGRYVIAHVAKTQDEGLAVRKLIKSCAEMDGKDCTIDLPKDPGQAGKSQSQDMIAMLAGYKAYASPESGSKELRAEPFAAQCEAGNVYLVEGEWNASFLDEICLFPAGKFADQVDASSRAFARLASIKAGGAGIAFPKYAD